MTSHVVSTDVLQNKHGTFVSVDRVRWPELPWEVANKSYVDFASGVGYTYVPPLHKDDILLQVYVDDADLTHKGVVTLTDQTFTGDKYFTGDVHVTQEVFINETSPSTNNSAVTLAYVTQQFNTAITATLPLTKTALPGPVYNLAVNNAAGSNPGVISGVAQTLGGDITLAGATKITGSELVSGASTFTGAASFTNANTVALTDPLWTSPSAKVATGDYVRQATLGAGFDAGNGWIAGLPLAIGVAQSVDASDPMNPVTQDITYTVGGGNYRFSKYQPNVPAPGIVVPQCGPVVTHADFGEQIINSSLYPALGQSTVVSVYIRDEVDGGFVGKCYASAGVSSTDQLYQDYIQVGALVLITVPTPYYGNTFFSSAVWQATAIAAASNVHIPFADRVNISQVEIATLICPINYAPKPIVKTLGNAASPSIPLDMAAGGLLWEYAGNTGFGDPYNRHTISLPAWSSNVQGIYPVWQDNLSNLRTVFPAVPVIDTAHWNQLASTTQLGRVTSGKWYNSPILYNPSAQIFLQQYPTAEYDDVAAAQEKAHAFTRMTGAGGEARYLICMGVVTYAGTDKWYRGEWTIATMGTVFPSATEDGEFYRVTDAGTMNFTPQAYVLNDIFKWDDATKRYLYFPAASNQGAWDATALNGTIYPTAGANGDFWIVSVGGIMNYAAPQAYATGDRFVWNGTTKFFDRVPAASPIPVGVDNGNWDIGASTTYPAATIDGEFWTITNGPGSMNYAPVTYVPDDIFKWNDSTKRYVQYLAGTDNGPWSVAGDGTTYPVAAGDGDFWTISDAGGLMNYTPITFGAGDWFVWDAATQLYVYAASAAMPADYGTTSVLSGGEYFNYQAAGGSGGGGAAGGGGGGIASVLELNTAWLQASPCSTTGTMNYISDPFPTYNAAAGAAALVALETSPTLIHLTAGRHISGATVLRPWVSLAGFSMGSTYYDMQSNFMTAHIDWGSKDNARISIRNMRLVAGGIDFDLVAAGGDGTDIHSTFDIYDCEVEGATTLVARKLAATDLSGDEFRFTVVALHGVVTIDGGNLIMNNVFFRDENVGDDLLLQSTNAQLDGYLVGCLLRDTHVYGVAGSNKDINITISGCFLQDAAALTIDHDVTYSGTITVRIDRASLPFPTSTRLIYDPTDAQIVFDVYDEEESQQNLIYMSAVGRDDRSGVNLNNAVLTLPTALGLCTTGGASAAEPYTVVMLDAGVLPSGGTQDSVFGKYCSVQAPSAVMAGTMSIKAGSRVQFKEIRGAVTMTGGDATDPANDVECNSLTAAVAVAASQPALRLKFSSADSGGAAVALVTASAGSNVYMCGDAVTGLITATGAGAFVDVSGVRDLRNATFATASGGTIRYGPNFGANMYQTGMLKGTTSGVLQTATPGSDYLIGTQNITLGGDVSATGALTTNPIGVTIANNAVTAGKIETAPAWSILARQAGTSGNSAWYTDGATLTASGAVMRDASGNVLANHAVEGFATYNSAQTLTLSSPAYIQWSGGAGVNCTIPNSGVNTGFKYTFYNAGTSDLVLYTTAPAAAVATVPAKAYCDVIWDNGASIWRSVQLVSSASVVPVASLPTAPAWSVLANQTGSSATPVYVTGGSDVTLNGFVARDASGNSIFNHATDVATIINFTTGGAATATATTGGFIRLTGVSGTLTLPVKTALATGFSFDVFNAASGSIDVRNSAAASQLVLATGEFARFVNGTPASASWDVYPFYQTVTLTGPVTGSGIKTIATTIAAGQIPLSGIATITGSAVLGRLASGAGAVIAQTSASTVATFDSVVHRNGSGNSLFNHAMETYVLMTNAGSGLTESSPAYIQYSGAALAMSLPATTGLTAGFRFSFFNSGANALVLNNYGGGAAATVPAYSYADVIWDTAGTPGWRTFNLQTSASVVPVGNLATIASPSVLGNISGSSAVPTTITAASIATTASSVVLRNTAGNFSVNHAMETYALFNTGTQLAQTSPAYFQFSKASDDTMTLPATSADTPNGFKFSVYNAGAGALTINNSAGSAQGTLPANSYADVIWNGSSWVVLKLAGQGGVIAPTQMQTAPAWSIFANQTSGTAVPTYYTLGSANTANGAVARDSSGNFACAHVSQTFSTLTANSVSLAETHPAYFQYSGAGTTYLMPATANLANGFKFTIYNLGAGALLLQNSTGTTYATNGTIPATSTADCLWDSSAGTWKCFKYANYDNVPASSSFSSSITFNITTGSQALILNGACTTTSASPAITLVSWPATNMGTSGTMVVEYSAECVASGTGTSGAFLGAFRAKYASAGPSISFPGGTTFISEIKELDAGVSTCKITASSTAGTLLLQANGNAGTLYWTGQMRITYRVW